MTALPKTTIRRLRQLPQTNNIWEGDRRCLPLFNSSHLSTEAESPKDCILWVDSSSGMVRATDIISADTPIEATVRTLLRAIQKPDGPNSPARPQKIIVRDRQLQFFLRGALQNLDIAIDYAPSLPLIDELFEGWEIPQTEEPPALPLEYELLLNETAAEIWRSSPWEVLCDHHVISIKIDLDESEQLYGCVVGKQNQEYAVILYRSLESIMQFRTAAAVAASDEAVEVAFLSQDCWFINFDAQDPNHEDLTQLDWTEIHPIFGSIHPYEGIRLSLDSQEAAIVLVALKGLCKFYRQYGELPERSGEANRLTNSDQTLCETYSISYWLNSEIEPRQASVEVSTNPEISQSLWLEEHKYDWDQEDTPLGTIAIRDDLIPSGTFISLSSLPQQLITQLKSQSNIHIQTRPALDDIDSTELLELDLDPTQSQTGAVNGLVQKIFDSKPAGDLIGDRDDSTEAKSRSNCHQPNHALDSTNHSKQVPVVIVQTSRPKAKAIIEQIKAAGGLKLICFHQGNNEFLETSYDLGLLQTHNGNIYLLTEYLRNQKPNSSLIKWCDYCQQNQNRCSFIIAMGITGASKGNPQPKHIMAVLDIEALSWEAQGILQLMSPFEF